MAGGAPLGKSAASGPLLLPQRVLCPYLNGFGQVIFAESWLGGVMIIIGLFVGDPWLAVVSMVGCLAGTVTADIVSLDQSVVTKGLMGYNGVLVGCGFAVFLGFEVWTWQPIVATALGGVAQVGVMMALSNMQESPVWTFPFNWVLTCTLLYIRPFDHWAPPPHPVYDWDLFTLLEVAEAIPTGISQIFVVKSWVAGIIIVLGLLCSSWKLAASTVLGSTVGLLAAMAIGANAAQIKDGLWGYDSALTAASICTFFEPTRAMMAFMVVASAGTVVLHAGIATLMARWMVPCGTLPFCIAATLCYKMIGKVRGLHALQEGARAAEEESDSEEADSVLFGR